MNDDISDSKKESCFWRGSFLCAGCVEEINSFAARAPRAGREDGSSLPDCAGPHSGEGKQSFAVGFPYQGFLF